jgi:hypothetical protein
MGESMDSRLAFKRLTWVAIYAVAMGLLEAICVIYLRKIYPVATNYPIPPLDEMGIEVIREVCTITMLMAVAWLGGSNFLTRTACFFYAFGIWDILYYVGLRWLNDWPTGPFDWDCLFFIPKPWYGPVLAPVLISAYFCLSCILIYFLEARGRPIRLTMTLILSQLAAFGIWYWSFVKDSDGISALGFENFSYSWQLFAAGAFVACAGLLLCKKRKRPTPAPPTDTLTMAS